MVKGAAPGGKQPADTEAAQPSKKQERDKQRRQEFRAKKLDALWVRLSITMLRRDRWQYRQDVWTRWMRARLSPRRDARRALRLLFWREWTRPQFEAEPTVSDLASSDDCRQLGFADIGLRSLRDRYIHERARKRCEQLAATCPWALRLRRVRYWLGGEWKDAEGCLNRHDREVHDEVFAPWVRNSLEWKDTTALRAAPVEARARMLMSLQEGIMFSPRDPGIAQMHASITASLSAAGQESMETVETSAGGRKDSVRSREEAGLPTPPSTRAARKRRGGRR